MLSCTALLRNNSAHVYRCTVPYSMMNPPCGTKTPLQLLLSVKSAAQIRVCAKVEGVTKVEAFKADPFHVSVVQIFNPLPGLRVPHLHSCRTTPSGLLRLLPR